MWVRETEKGENETERGRERETERGRGALRCGFGRRRSHLPRFAIESFLDLIYESRRISCTSLDHTSCFVPRFPYRCRQGVCVRERDIGRGALRCGLPRSCSHLVREEE